MLTDNERTAILLRILREHAARSADLKAAYVKAEDEDDYDDADELSDEYGEAAMSDLDALVAAFLSDDERE